MKRILFLALLCLPFIGKTQSNVKTDWKADFTFLKAELPKNHFNLYSVRSEKDYFAGIEHISGMAESLSDFSIAVMLQQLIAKFGDSHTMTGWSQLADIDKILPLNLMWFEDGLFVIHTTEENQSILGSEILKINGTPLAIITDSLRTLVTEDNKAVIKKELPKLIIYIQLLEHFGFAKSGPIELLLENQKGEQFTHSIKPGTMTRQNRKSFVPDAIALCYVNGRSLFKDTILTADNTYYIQYNACASREYPPQGFRGNPEQLPSFTEFRKKIMETINQNDFDKLVFDIRFNGGGNSVPGSELVRELSAVKKINQKGKLFVIIGRDTYSSAILNAMDFKNLTQAIFVGEETAGKPNHFGEIKLLQLPNSGLKIQYSTKYFKYSPTDLPTLTPDHPIGVSFKDFATGHDPVYDWIKEQ